jgi:hypothetical protein
MVPRALQASENGDLSAPFVRRLAEEGLRPGQFIYGHPGTGAALPLRGRTCMTVVLREPREQAISNYLWLLQDWRLPDHAAAKAGDFRAFLKARPYFAIFQTASLHVGVERRPLARTEDLIDRLPDLIEYLREFELIGTTETEEALFLRACQVLRLADPPKFPHHRKSALPASRRQEMREQYQDLERDPELGPLIRAERALFLEAEALAPSKAAAQPADRLQVSRFMTNAIARPPGARLTPKRGVPEGMARERDLTSADPIQALLSLTDERSRPNINALWRIAKDMDALRLNVKFFGYQLAEQLAAALPVREGMAPQSVGLVSKACTQEDMESDWVACWCGELRIPLIFHRKVWEFAYVLQAFYEAGKITPGARGLGFGCGEEPIASYLASKGLSVTVTDLPPADRKVSGWANTHQHAGELRRAHHARIVDLETFERNASLEYVDMNDIPPGLRDYDLCWSICAFEHLGSIQRGLDFVENALAPLKPGGVAVHTTEFNFFNDKETLDNWPTVLFQRRHFRELASRLEQKGHRVAPLDFRVGSKPMDQFIDIPPFVHDWPEEARNDWGAIANHLKVNVDGFPCTCFGLTITKAAG